MARETSHEVPKPAVRKLVIDVVEPSISVEIPTVQQEVNPVIDVGWKEIFKSIEDKAERWRKAKANQRPQEPKGSAANMVGCHHEEEEPVYAFTVREKNEKKIGVNVGGCKLNMIIDSGASTNIIDKQTWEWLKKNKVKSESARSSRKLYAYASQTPLDVIRTFSCEVSAGSNTASATFCVINGERDPFLG